jgi:phage terminase large subunit
MPSAPQNLRRWREVPTTFVRDVFGITPDPWQDEVLAAFPNRPRLAMKACKGPGKTAVMA